MDNNNTVVGVPIRVVHSAVATFELIHYVAEFENGFSKCAFRHTHTHPVGNQLRFNIAQSVAQTSVSPDLRRQLGTCCSLDLWLRQCAIHYSHDIEGIPYCHCSWIGDVAFCVVHSMRSKTAYLQFV